MVVTEERRFFWTREKLDLATFCEYDVVLIIRSAADKDFAVWCSLSAAQRDRLVAVWALCINQAGYDRYLHAIKNSDSLP